MKSVVLLGRVLYSAIFITSGFNHIFNSPSMVGYAESMGVPMAAVMVPVSGVLALVGGLSILLGFHAKRGAWFIVAFLVPVTFMMHQFWGLSDPQAAMMQMVNFNKNMAMLGGALLIAHFGTGPLSIKE